MKTVFFNIVVLFLLLLNTNAVGQKVKINQKSSGGFELLVNKKPVFVKGAVGSDGIDLVKKYGGNAVRAGYSKRGLDKAHDLGLMVLVNLPVA